MEPDAESGIRIPFEQLPPATLEAVIEEFVTRDGTEMTEARRKIDQVTEALRCGEAEVWFDQVTKTCNILRV